MSLLFIIEALDRIHQISYPSIKVANMLIPSFEF